jgi:hypothetical protein
MKLFARDIYFHKQMDYCYSREKDRKQNVWEAFADGRVGQYHNTLVI